MMGGKLLPLCAVPVLPGRQCRSAGSPSGPARLRPHPLKHADKIVLLSRALAYQTSACLWCDPMSNAAPMLVRSSASFGNAAP